MTKRLFFFSILIMSSFLRCYAQVNMQTGSAVFSLPMFNWVDDKSRLNSIVALSYSSGNGLKVNDVASNVGQGWNVVAGGVITRLQIGGPDDQMGYAGSNGGGDMDVTKYPPGILHATVPASNGCPEALTKYPIYKSMNQVYTQHNVIAEDKELDYFNFQFNGKAGVFVLNPNDIGVGYSLGDTKMKITFEQDLGLVLQGIRTTITSFRIHDVDGLIYKFTVHGKVKVLRANYFDKNFIEKQTQPDFESGKVYRMAGFETSQIVNPYIINSWYLSEIEDALTHRKIFFNYEIRDINTIAGMDISHSKEKNYSIITYKNSITKTPEISSIVYPDGHTVSFNYGDNRIDLNGAKVLSSIDITYGGRSLSRYLFTTSYFIKNRYGSPVSDYQKNAARLCLLSVQKIGVDLREDTPPYIFDYYMGSNTTDDYVPPPFFYARDIWGFYNGTSSVSYEGTSINLDKPIMELTNEELKGLCFLRNTGSGGGGGVGSFTTDYFNSKDKYARNGLLRQIVYPTGGALTYEYEQNAGYIGGDNYTIGGVHVSRTSSTDGGHSNGCDNPISTDYAYVVDGPGSASSLWGIEMPVNYLVTNSHYAAEKKVYYWSFSCGILGCCKWKYQYPGILFQQQSVDIPAFQRIMSIISPILGIISVISTIVDIATLIGTAAPGVGTIVAVIIDVVCGLISLAITCFSGNHSRDDVATIYYNSDLNGIAPLPGQFKRIEVTESPGAIGKTVQEFTSADDYPIWVYSNPAFAAKQRFAPWAYGLPKRTIVYDAAGDKIKQTENEYSFENAKVIIDSCNNHYESALPPCDSTSGVPSVIVSCKCMVTKTYSQRSDHWSDYEQHNPNYQTVSNSDMKVDFYGMYSGRVSLVRTREKVFKIGDQGQYAETMTEYEYNVYNYEVNKVTITQSNGDKSIKEIRYSGGMFGGIYTTLQNSNMIGIPLETINSVIKSGTSVVKDLSERRTHLIQLANGDIKPETISERRSDIPYDRYPYPSVLPVIQTFTYDASGNLVGVEDEGGRQVINLYDYNDKYVVASVINANSLFDACAYTSFETDGFGGWTLSGGPVSYSATSITGARSFSLGKPYSLSAPLNPAKSYKLSAWSTGSLLVSGSAVLTKSVTGINGFVYYEYDIPQGTFSVTVSALSSLIDELRLYPATARMSSTTYDPLIGKTSECDVNNRITYYEYDNLGRLQFIRDDKKNIVKMYEYNNVSASKQNGCPTIYYNRFISETFTRNNCGAGYVGGSVTYTIPANTYSSTVSQLLADLQAAFQLLVYGQTYANANGSCTQLYYNTLQSQNFTTESCEDGYAGGTVTYTVPANKYSSTISQADANHMALEEIAANGQAYANDPANAVCDVDTDPYWEWEEGGDSYCLSVDGQLPPHLFVLAKDINPNSPTYNQMEWKDTGPNDACPANTYYNAAQSAQFTRNNCGSGLVGTTVTYTVPAGTYSSTVSQAAADLLASNDIAANGQAYANANGSCVSPPSCTEYQITVPNNVASNLYVVITYCGTSTPVILNWNTQFLLNCDDPWSCYTTVCLANSTINFRYGYSGNNVSIPQITITSQGSCQ